MTLLVRKTKYRSGIRDGDGPLRSSRHLKFIRGFACACGCGLPGRIEAAHTRIGTDGSLSEKPSDAWALPLLADQHARAHAIGERSFWASVGRNPHKLAIELARMSPDPLVKEFSKTMVDRWL